MRRVLASSASFAVVLALVAARDAYAQRGPRQPPQQAPAPPTPTKSTQVGPRAGQDEEGTIQVTQRSEPVAAPPADPLSMSDDVRSRIGSDAAGAYAAPNPDSATHYTRFEFPLFVQRRGDYQMRLLPPLVLEHTRGLPDPSSPPLYGIPKTPDTEGLYGLFYYRRRSQNVDADVLFPLAWRLRLGESKTYVLGPIVHREAPGESDNWLAPLVMAGSRKDGGYFHSPILLTTSHWGPEGAFTLVGPYFRDRTGTDVDAGVVPFYFHGDNGNVDGARRTYTLIPPLLYYRRTRELEQSTFEVIGPVIRETNPKRDILDVAPFFFHIKGKPETGGVDEEHTTVFPLLHYGRSPTQNLFVVPGYLRRTTPTTDTMITPFYSHAETRNGSTQLTAVGPVLPLYWRYTDRDLGVSALAVAPLFYTSDSPTGHDWLTPLIGRFESYGVSRTWWVFPSFQFTNDVNGWASNLHPLLYFGRDKDSSHSVIAPIFWDFANPRKRTTIAFPLYWRFSESADESVTQIAGNTLYMQKRVAGGLDWQFHFLPLFSYGEHPQGYWWNVLFGLAGYDRTGGTGTVKALWIPIEVSHSAAVRAAASR